MSYTPSYTDDEGNEITIGSIVFINKRNAEKDRPYKVMGMTFAYQGNGKPLKVTLKLNGLQNGVDANRCLAVDTNSDFGRVVELLSKVGGKFDRDVIYEYLTHQGLLARGVLDDEMPDGAPESEDA